MTARIEVRLVLESSGPPTKDMQKDMEYAVRGLLETRFLTRKMQRVTMHVTEMERLDVEEA